MHCSHRARLRPLLLLLLPILFARPAWAQPATVVTALLPPSPPTRQWVISATPFVLLPDITPNLRAERVLRPHFTALLDGAFGRYYSRSVAHRWRTTNASLGLGARYYLAGRAPKGLYAEGVVHGQLYRVQDSQRPTYRQTQLVPEVGVGYQFVFGRRQRIALDVGMRLKFGPLINLPAHLSTARFGVLLMPAFRLGVAF